MWPVPQCDWGAHLQFTLRKLILAPFSLSSPVDLIHPRSGELPLTLSSGRTSWEPSQGTVPNGTPNAFDNSTVRTCRHNCHRNIYRVSINPADLLALPGFKNLHALSSQDHTLKHRKVSGISALTCLSSTPVIFERATKNLLLIWCAIPSSIFFFCGVIICCQSLPCGVCAFMCAHFLRQHKFNPT